MMPDDYFTTIFEEARAQIHAALSGITDIAERETIVTAYRRAAQTVSPHHITPQVTETPRSGETPSDTVHRRTSKS